MELFEALFSRKSVRRYNGKTLTDEELALLLKAAQAAPIGRARYASMQLTVIRDRALIEEWEQRVSDATGAEAHPFYGAPVVLLVSSVMLPPPQDNVKYSDAAIISQNVALAATALGIGACHIWGAVRVLNTRPDLIAKFGVDADKVPCCAIALGHTDEVYCERDIAPDRIKVDFKD